MKQAKLRDSNVILEDQNTKGFCSEIAMPDIQFSTTEMKNIANIGTLNYFEGIEKLELTAKFVAPESNIIKTLTNPFDEVKLQVRSQRDVYANGKLSEEQPSIYFVRGLPCQSTNGTRKKGESGEREFKINVYYIKEVQNGETLYEIDVRNNIFIVGGVDLLENYRQNLGLDV